MVMECFTKNIDRINGHNPLALNNSLNKFFSQGNKEFSIIFCNTIKGYGLKIAEGNKKYHYRCPTEDGYKLSNDN
jgi:transketolase